MVKENWLAIFDEIVSETDIRNLHTRALAAFVDRYADGVASFVEARRKDDRELIVLDVRTGAPQHPACDIKKTERLAVLFIGNDAQPLVIMLRDDFPDTEHQQLVPEGFPAIICIDDRPWAEAELTWTPAELVERIVSWFHRAARGELQDARQPLDPNLMGSPLGFLIARSILAADVPEDLIAEHDAEHHHMLRVKRFADAGEINKSMEPFCIAAYRVPPESMTRFRYAPGNLDSLAAMLSERGIDLFADLKKRFGEWIAESETAAWRLNARFAVIVEMPIVAPGGELRDGTDHRAFVTTKSAGEIAVALGVAYSDENADVGSKVGYLRPFGKIDIDESAVAAIELQHAEVHLDFERDLATRLAGRNEPDTRRAVLIGAGAMGSHLADCLVREGRFKWTIIDDDRLLPHNLARHIARKGAVSRQKAGIVASHMNELLLDQEAVAEPIAANLFANGEAGDKIEKALSDADIIIDATASVVAERALSDHASDARRICTFFNPTGEAAVLLSEPLDRALTLRDLEAQYLGLVLRTDRLSRHLGVQADTIAYTGACRAITNRIPQSQVNVLTGLAASGLGKAVDSDEGSIAIWSISPEGAVTIDAVKPETALSYRVLDWVISIDAGLIQRIHDMRDERLPAETGGLLFGLVDIPASRIHLVDASLAPPDSKELPDGFERGIQGVEELLDSVRRRTAGQVRYVGEWHSHPPRASARPSTIDAQQIDWLAALMRMDSIPALMLIAGDSEFSVIFANETAYPINPENERPDEAA